MTWINQVGEGSLVSVSEYKLGLLPRRTELSTPLFFKHRSKNVIGSHQRCSRFAQHYSPEIFPESNNSIFENSPE